MQVDTTELWKGRNLSARVLFTAAGVAQQVLIESSASSLLVDVGDGTLRDLLSAGARPRKLNAILITHGHFDHIGGLHSLLGFQRMVGRTAPLDIVAPRGCHELLGIVENFHRCYPDSIPFKVNLREARNREAVEINDLVVEVFDVVHCGSVSGSDMMPQIPACGYRISCGDEVIAITGDTGRDADLDLLLRDADLAVIEATHADSLRESESLLRRVHLDESTAKELGGLARDFMLVHRSRRY